MNMLFMRSSSVHTANKKTKTYIIDNHRRISHEFRRLPNTESFAYQRAFTPSSLVTAIQLDENGAAASNVNPEPVFMKVSQKNKMNGFSLARHQPRFMTPTSLMPNTLGPTHDNLTTSGHPQRSLIIKYNSDSKAYIKHPLEKYFENESLAHPDTLDY